MRASPKVLLTTASILLILGTMGLIAVAAWNFLISPQPYANATRTGLHWPTVVWSLEGNCARETFITKSFYTAHEPQNRLISWFRNHGWMTNYRYEDSVIHKSSQQLSGLALDSVQEIFVENAANGSHFVSTTQTTLSVGNC